MRALYGAVFIAFSGMLFVGCTFFEQDLNQVSATVVFDEAVDTPRISSVNVRLLQFVGGLTSGAISLGEQNIEGPDPMPLDFNFEFGGDRDPGTLYLSVQLFFSGNNGRFRKSFVQYGLQGNSPHVTVVAEQPVVLTAEGYVQEPQTVT